MPGPVQSDTLYKACAALGILIVLITPYVTWQQVLSFESTATRVFEERILTRLDLESLNAQLNSVNTAIDKSSGEQSGSADYTSTQVQHLLNESENLKYRIDRTRNKLKGLDSAKSELIGQIKLLFAAALLVTAAGLVVAVLGAFGWYFHVRIYPERRSVPRNRSESAG